MLYRPNPSAKSGTPHRGSRVLTWSLVLAGIMLLYFLSVPWVTAYSTTHESFAGAFVHQYLVPWHFVSENTPLQSLMERYYEWCWTKSGIYLDH